MTRTLPDNIDWPEQTRLWWDAWASHPVTEKWTEVDWEFLTTTALVHATVWGAGDMTKAGELRAREERLGGLVAAAGGKTPAPVVKRKENTGANELQRRREAREART